MITPTLPAAGGSTWPQTAAETTLRVLRWAAGQPGSAGRPAADPPRGSVRSPSGVARSPVVATELRTLARATAARIGAGHPILGDETPITLGGAFLATAGGCREQPDIARRLAALIGPPAIGRRADAGWADALARHAVAGPAVACAGELTDAWLAASPLTAVLSRPADGQDDLAADAAIGLLSRPYGRQVFVATLAACDSDPRVLLWRARLLNRIAHTHSGVVVEVYTAARSRDGGDWDRELGAAAQRLAAASPAAPPDERAIAAARYWSALEARQISGSVPGALWRDEVQPAVMLVRRYRLAEVRTA